jgi:hypothetical protein
MLIRSRFKTKSSHLRRKLRHAARVMGPTLVALTFAGVAHAQGTMDFSGAQTLMGTFKTILAILKMAGGWHPSRPETCPV